MAKNLLIIAIFGILIGSGFYYLKNNMLTSPLPAPAPDPSSTTSAPTPAPSLAPVPVPAPAAAPSTHNTIIQDFAFNQSSLTIKKGDTIIWTNKDSAPHTVTGDGGLSSPTLKSNSAYSFTFNTTGTFKYHCSFHPSMNGTVTVIQ